MKDSSNGNALLLAFQSHAIRLASWTFGDFKIMRVQSSFQRDNLERLAIQANYDGKALARLFGISPRQLQRLFKSTLGCSPQSWLNELRIFHAKERLLAGQPIKTVAIDLYYKHTSHFCYQFKSMMGVTPSEFALLHQNS